VIYISNARYVKYACFTYLTYFAYLQIGWITLDARFQAGLWPAGNTGTIPYSMHSESALYPGATCDSRNGAGIAKLGAGGGMSTLGQWHGPWNYEMETVTTINGKSNWVWHENGNNKYANNMQEICKEYAKNMQRICKTYARNMHENMQEICEPCVKYAS
jgi:hypothetical protein